MTKTISNINTSLYMYIFKAHRNLNRFYALQRTNKRRFSTALSLLRSRFAIPQSLLPTPQNLLGPGSSFRSEPLHLIQAVIWPWHSSESFLPALFLSSISPLLLEPVLLPQMEQREDPILVDHSKLQFSNP